MKLNPYPAYKPSGVDGSTTLTASWLGDVPDNWELQRFRFLARTRKGRLPSETYPAPLSENDLPYLSMEFLRGATDSPSYVPYSSNLVRAGTGDILVLWDGSNAGEFLHAKQGVVSSTAALLEVRGIAEDFMFFVCKAIEPQVKDQTVGMGIPHVAGDELKSFPIPLPPHVEQLAIAAFLDRETGKIDRLVAKKWELIDKLKEERAAIISRAVTRGRNPDAKLKPSGVQWLGNVPEHWEVKPIRMIATIGNGSTPSRDNALYWEDGHYPWLNSSVVNQESVTQADQFVTDFALKECHLPRIIPPAILIGITGQGKTRGLATTLQIEATINQHIAFVDPFSDIVDVKYLRRVFDMAYSHLRNESDGGGSTKGAITCDQIKGLRVPVPPLPEQRVIADFLDRETGKIDRLAAKVEEAIGRLQEYRAALITAAVTGKIDVRASAGMSKPLAYPQPQPELRMVAEGNKR